MPGTLEHVPHRDTLHTVIIRVEAFAAKRRRRRRRGCCFEEKLLLGTGM